MGIRTGNRLERQYAGQVPQNEVRQWKGIEKIADNLQAAAGRKKCREIERANSFYEGYEQGIEDMLRSIRQEGRK